MAAELFTGVAFFVALTLAAGAAATILAAAVAWVGAGAFRSVDRASAVHAMRVAAMTGAVAVAVSVVAVATMG